MKKVGFVLTCCLTWFTTLAQINPDSIRASVERQNMNFPQEKIYLHLDKPYYAPGDTVWFKAYLMDAVAHLSDTVSKRIYVDLFRKDRGTLVQGLVLKNKGGFSNGDIVLSDSLPEGLYEIRAFTNWMRNFPDEYFFHKEVFVRNRDVRHDQYGQQEMALEDQVADLQFFAEGGNLIGGLPNRVAFKAVNKYGRGVVIKAQIISDHGDTVATIQSQHRGMGSFIFTPNVGAKYFSKVDKSVTATHFDLPEVLSNGYTFFVDNLSSKDFIKIIIRLKTATKDRPILIGHQRGRVIFAVQSPTEEDSFYFSLRKSDIPTDGVMHLTLFDAIGNPQCERLIYHDMKAPLHLSLSSGRSEYKAREEVKISIALRDAQGNPVQGNVSLSVTDVNQVMSDSNGENILSYLQLTSDIQNIGTAPLHEIKGIIEEPFYYFDKSNRNAPIYLDVLLMSQGWRRFLWKDVLNTHNKESEPQYSIETGITLQGMAVLPNGKVAPKPIGVSLFYHPEAGTTEYLKTNTDASGKFIFNQIEVNGDMDVMVQGVKEKGGRYVLLTADRWKRPVFAPGDYEIDPFLFDREKRNQFIRSQQHYAQMDANLRRGKVTMLEEVVIKGEPIVDRRRLYYSGLNPTKIVVNELDCGSALTIFQMIQAQVAGVQVDYRSGTGTVVLIRGKAPAYLLDGFEVEIEVINTIRPCSVESIEIVKHPSAMLNATGVISILTKAGNPNYDGPLEPARGVIVANIQGYHVPKEFYCPKYTMSKADSLQNLIPDFRSTIYWNPSIETDKQGNAQVNFRNSGEQTSMRVSVEGISQQGKPLYATYTYKVN